MNESKFSQDIKSEAWFSSILDKDFYPKFIEKLNINSPDNEYSIKRINDMESQYKGIDLNGKNPPFVTDSIKKIRHIITTIISKNKAFKKKSFEQRNYYFEKYSMKKNTENFIKQNIRF